jgi:hypothetical protein
MCPDEGVLPVFEDLAINPAKEADRRARSAFLRRLARHEALDRRDTYAASDGLVTIL